MVAAICAAVEHRQIWRCKKSTVRSPNVSNEKDMSVKRKEKPGQNERNEGKRSKWRSLRCHTPLDDATNTANANESLSKGPLQCEWACPASVYQIAGDA